MTTIRGTITRSIALVVLLVCSITFAAVFLFMRTRMIQQFDLSLQTTAETVSGLVQIDQGKLELDERDESLSEFRRAKRPAYFEVCDQSGTPLLRSTSLVESMHLPTLQPGKIIPARLPDGRSGRLICLALTPHVESDDDQAPAKVESGSPVLLYVARDSVDLDATLRWMAISLLIALSGILMSVVLLIPRLVRSGLKPLDELSDRAARLDAANLSERFPTDSAPAELAPVAIRLNESLDRIAAAFARERRFASDAAHELRTPLAAIRANAEVAMKWPEPDQVRSSLADIATASIRMTRLVERLLELARLTHSHDDEQLQQVNLSLMVRESVDRCFVGQALHRLIMNIPDSITCHTQPDLLAPMLDNILNNAITHSPEHSEISITLTSGNSTTLSITNQAPHLSQHDLSLMFDPLWTKSTDRSAAHAGLGLALVSEYARALGIRIAPRLETDGAFAMLVIIPSSSSDSHTLGATVKGFQ